MWADEFGIIERNESLAMRFIRRMIMVLLTGVGLIASGCLLFGFCWLVHKGVERFVPNDDNHWTQDAVSAAIVVTVVFVPFISWVTLKQEDEERESK